MREASVAYTLEKGKPMTLTIAATAGNVATNLTPGTGYMIKLLYGSITLTTDGTVANRYIYTKITTAAPNDIVTLASAGPRAASGTFIWSFVCRGYNTTAGMGVDQWTGLGDITVYDTDILNITIVAGVAGDSYSGRIKYLLVRRN